MWKHTAHGENSSLGFIESVYHSNMPNHRRPLAHYNLQSIIPEDRQYNYNCTLRCTSSTGLQLLHEHSIPKPSNALMRCYLCCLKNSTSTDYHNHIPKVTWHWKCSQKLDTCHNYTGIQERVNGKAMTLQTNITEVKPHTQWTASQCQT